MKLFFAAETKRNALRYAEVNASDFSGISQRYIFIPAPKSVEGIYG